MVLVPDLDPEIKVPTARHTDSLGDEHRQGEGLRGSQLIGVATAETFSEIRWFYAPSVARLKNY